MGDYHKSCFLLSIVWLGKIGGEKRDINRQTHVRWKYMHRMQIQFCQCLLTLTSNARWSSVLCGNEPPPLPQFHSLFSENHLLNAVIRHIFRVSVTNAWNLSSESLSSKLPNGKRFFLLFYSFCHLIQPWQLFYSTTEYGRHMHALILNRK